MWTVKFYNDAKGFGFIQNGQDELFFHITQCVWGYQPRQGDNVSFQVSQGKDGRPAAVNVWPQGGHSEWSANYADHDEDM